MSLTDAQREARRAGIGGSDAAAVVGRHPTKTPLALYIDKVYGDDFEGNARTEAGNRLEPVIREWAAEKLGETFTLPDTMYHPKTRRMLVNLDGLLSSGWVLECKNVDGLVWRASQDELVDGVLRTHWWQVQHAVEVVDAPGAVVAYLVAGNDLILERVERNRVVGDRLRRHIEAWWERHIIAQVPPENGSADDRMSLLEKLHAKESAGMLKTDAESIVSLAREYDACRKAVAVAEKNRDIAKANLCSVIGSAAGLDLGPVGKVTWKAGKNGVRTLNVRMADTEQHDG